MALNIDTDHTPLVEETDYKNKSTVLLLKNKKCWIVIAITIIVVVAISLLLYFVLREDEQTSHPQTRNQYFEQQFLQIPSNNSCYNLSHLFASEPHVAIDQRTYELATILTTMFTDFGYDVIRDNITNMVFDHYISSSLSLTLPNSTTVLIDLSNSLIPGDQETNTSLRARAWQPFSASGNVMAPLLYVGDASNVQLDYLQFNLSLNLSNYIAFVTDGSRAPKMERIGMRGMKGMIQFERNYNDPDTVYPYGAYRPNTGYMYGRIRGSSGCPGGVNPSRLVDQCGFNMSVYDDLFPSIKYNVPSIIISAQNAINIFKLFANSNNSSKNDAFCDILPANWHPGNLPIDGLCVGGNVIANLSTENEIKYNDTIQNVYGYFEGDTYPDEIVMIGAHRDAWGVGAADDISGTVTMMEIARALSVLRDEYNWTSRRSLMFGSWDGEEWGLYGSVDFNENQQNREEFVNKIVTYINFDMTVTGQNMVFLSNPLFRSLLFDASQQLNYPYDDHGFSKDMSLYHVWSELNPSGNLRLVTTGSDYGAFEYYSGIPTLGVRFDTYPQSFPDVYHTFYDLNGVLDIMDPQWNYAQRIASLGGLLMLKVAQSQILPWDVLRFADKMVEWLDNDLVNRAANVADCSIDAYVDDLKEAVIDFRNSANVFDEVRNSYVRANNNDEENMDPQQVQRYNKILMELTRRLTLKYPQGMPSNMWYKQMIIDPGSKRFPYIWDRITVGCDVQELEEAFLITSSMIYNASELLQSVL